jgi:DNA-directed RNA polymerase subunit M/transcription elongation factor TFIIS
MSVTIEFYISKKDRNETLELLSAYFDDKDIRNKIDEGFYDYTKQLCESNPHNLYIATPIYKDIVKNFIYNCEKGSNTLTKLKKLIKKGNFNPYNFAFLKPEELDEENWIKIILRRQITIDKLTNLPTVTWKECKRCKSSEYQFFQQQTRSADEPMTTFYICMGCGKVYKINN